MADERLSSVNLTILNEIQTSSSSFPKYTVWFDIDNTLYSKNCRIHDHMTEKIKEYFKTLGLPDKKADELHIKYYKEYGLAIRGLVRNHDIDPLDYDQKCDSAIPLEKLMKPDETVRKLLLDIDRSKARVWCLTNAYKTHALRVLKILNLIDLIDAVVSCDYTNRNFHCKPEPGSFL
ncbi:HAD-like domain-containing protein, partial [Phakopsora pachyrhizi]